MACVMNPAFWVYIIFLVAAIMIVRLALPAAAGFFGAGPLVMQILMIILWAIILAAGVYLIYGLFSCIFSAGFPSLPTGKRSDLAPLDQTAAEHGQSYYLWVVALFR